jgi:hypothetical protein
MTDPRRSPQTPAVPTDPDDPLVGPDYASWWNRGTALLRRCWKPLLAVQLIAAVITAAIEAVPTYEQVRVGLEQPGSEGAALSAGGLGLATLPFTVVVNAVAVLVSVHLLVTAATGGSPGLAAALRAARRRAGPLAGLSLLLGLAVVAGFFACVLPGLYLALVVLLLPPVVAFERRDPVARIFELFHTAVGAALSRTLTITGLWAGALVLAAVVPAVLRPFVVPAGTGPDAVWTGTVLDLVTGVFVTVPAMLLTAPLAVLTYTDLRGRTEPVSSAGLASELAR